MRETVTRPSKIDAARRHISTRSPYGASGLSNGCFQVGTIHTASTRGRAVASTQAQASWCETWGGLNEPPKSATRIDRASYHAFFAAVRGQCDDPIVPSLPLRFDATFLTG